MKNCNKSTSSIDEEMPDLKPASNERASSPRSDLSYSINDDGPLKFSVAVNTGNMTTSRLLRETQSHSHQPRDTPFPQTSQTKPDRLNTPPSELPHPFSNGIQPPTYSKDLRTHFDQIDAKIKTITSCHGSIKSMCNGRSKRSNRTIKTTYPPGSFDRPGGNPEWSLVKILNSRFRPQEIINKIEYSVEYRRNDGQLATDSPVWHTFEELNFPWGVNQLRMFHRRNMFKLRDERIDNPGLKEWMGTRTEWFGGLDYRQEATDIHIPHEGQAHAKEDVVVSPRRDHDFTIEQSSSIDGNDGNNQELSTMSKAGNIADWKVSFESLSLDQSKLPSNPSTNTSLESKNGAAVEARQSIENNQSSVVPPTRYSTPMDLDFDEGSEQDLPSEDESLAFENRNNTISSSGRNKGHVVGKSLRNKISGSIRWLDRAKKLDQSSSTAESSVTSTPKGLRRVLDVFKKKAKTDGNRDFKGKENEQENAKTDGKVEDGEEGIIKDGAGSESDLDDTVGKRSRESSTSHRGDMKRSRVTDTTFMELDQVDETAERNGSNNDSAEDNIERETSC